MGLKWAAGIAVIPLKARTHRPLNGMPQTKQNCRFAKYSADPISVAGFYELGCHVMRGYAAAARSKVLQGRGTKSYFGIARAASDKYQVPRSVIDLARLFATKFTTAEAQELIRLSEGTALKLTRRHVIALMSVKPSTKALALAKRCCREHWSARRLELTIRSGLAHPSQSGRRPRSPESMQEFCQQLMDAGHRWLSVYRVAQQVAAIRNKIATDRKLNSALKALEECQIAVIKAAMKGKRRRLH
jgi:hypothetical protein